MVVLICFSHRYLIGYLGPFGRKVRYIGWKEMTIQVPVCGLIVAPYIEALDLIVIT